MFGFNFFVNERKFGNPVYLRLLASMEGNEMPLAEDYRRYAAECLALAQQGTTPQDRARLLEMAHAFNELAIKLGEQTSDNH